MNGADLNRELTRLRESALSSLSAVWTELRANTLFWRLKRETGVWIEGAADKKTEGLLWVPTAAKLLHFWAISFVLRLLTDTAVSHNTVAQREFVRLFFPPIFSAMLEESVLPSRRLRTWILHLVQPPNTDIIYEGNHHQPWSEPCLPAPSSWPPTVFFVC